MADPRSSDPTGTVAHPTSPDPTSIDWTSVDLTSANPTGDDRAIRFRFHDGDVDALAHIYDRFARGVWAVAVGITRADHLAQEATQETFIRAWQAAGTYDPERDIGPWLFAIARFTSLDLLRRELRPTRGGHEVEQDQVIEAPGMDRAWLSWTVQEALRRLGENEREIIRLTFYEDLTHVQIAERLGLPVGTVKSRSHRAHRRLAELLAHVRDDGPPEDDVGPAVGSPVVDTVKSATAVNPSGPEDRTSHDVASRGAPAREGRQSQ